MRKCILALAALLGLSNAAPAAFWQGQTYAGPSQIAYNIVTDGGANCQDNHVVVTRNLTTVSGNTTVSVNADTFVNAPSPTGDVGKLIKLPGAGFGGSERVTTITGVSPFSAGSQSITVAQAPQTSLSGVSTNIVYGTDDSGAFMTFNTWARANQGASNQVVLTIPNGSDCWFGQAQATSGTSLLNAWAYGINNLIVEGTGARLNTEDGFGFTLGGFGICSRGLTDASGCSARIQSVSAGASQVTLTAASLAAGYASRFVVGQWLMVGGLNVQALWNSPFGEPPNLHFYEWREITAVDAGTGVITLDRPLTQTYLDTWPLYNSGNSGQPDAGGPATIYALGFWNLTHEYRGLTIYQGGQTYARGRNVTYRNVTFQNTHGGIPTQNENWSAINSDFTGIIMETDKLVGTMMMDGITIAQIGFQSSSTDLFVMRNSTVTTQLVGTPKNTEISDSTIAWFRPGAYAYGATTGYTICTRCNIALFTPLSGLAQNTPSEYSMSSGVISFLNTDQSGSDPAGRIFIPGGNIYWTGTGYPTVGLFNVGDITQDATNVFVQTNEAGTYPPVTGSPNFRTHPAPQWTCDDPDPASDPILIPTCLQAGATPLAPLGNYASSTYAPTSAQGILSPPLYALGKLVSVTINVTQAYSGTGSATLQVGGQFNNYRAIKQSDWSNFTFAPQINLKQAGERVITPSGVTCNGVSAPTGCSGDSLGTTPTEAIWLGATNGSGGAICCYMGSTLGVGTQPQFTVTVQTDQGVVP